MPRSLPPLNPLRSFEAAARHVSFTRAAEELGVTATAVGRQVAVLEAFLDRPLFDRRHSDLSLTEAGAAYLATVRPALETIASATGQLCKRRGTRLLVRCERSLALHWLSPRLARFRRDRPEIQVELSTRIGMDAAPPADYEVRIGSMQSADRNLVQRLLFEEGVGPVCAPAMLHGRAAPRMPIDLLNQPLLACAEQPQAWRDWLDAMGVHDVPPIALGFDDASLLYEGARQGVGFAIAPLAIVGDMLRSGALVAPFAPIAQGGAVHLAYRPSPGVSAAREFAQWLIEETRDERAAQAMPWGEAA